MKPVYASLAIIALLAISFAAGWFLSPDPDFIKEVRYDTTERILRVPTPVPVKEYYPVPGPADTFIQVEEKFADIDTAAIIEEYRGLYADYYLMREYRNTVLDDTTALLITLFSVWKNMLQKNQVIYRNRQPTSVTYRAREPPAGIHAGLFLLYGNNKIDLGAKVSADFGKNRFGAGYSLNKTLFLEYNRRLYL